MMHRARDPSLNMLLVIPFEVTYSAVFTGLWSSLLDGADEAIGGCDVVLVGINLVLKVRAGVDAEDGRAVHVVPKHDHFVGAEELEVFEEGVGGGLVYESTVTIGHDHS